MWVWGRMEHVKWTERIRNEAVLERVGEERIMLKLIWKRKRNWLGHWLRRKYLLKCALEVMVNWRRVFLVGYFTTLYQHLRVDGNSEGGCLLAFASRETDRESKAAYNIATSYFTSTCNTNSAGENLNYQQTIMTLAVDY
ncbi:hypothetical protein ANN_20513 [Periplaneta americana]|uniref:Uncharacterized protein n=1 Tax=Periplaneta americana TaxID=6978 RepID=A0ABQ8SCS9_PERAM|nr:hypothetical protein ANN_20513 [Periplaneta americana]